MKKSLYIIVYENWLKIMTPLQAIVYGIIYGLSKQDGFCTASDEYLARRLRVAKWYLQKLLKYLKERGYIEIQYDNLIPYNWTENPDMYTSEEIKDILNDPFSLKEQYGYEDQKQFEQDLISEKNGRIIIPKTESSGVAIKVWKKQVESGLGWLEILVWAYLGNIVSNWKRLAKTKKHVKMSRIREVVGDSDSGNKIKKIVQKLISDGFINGVEIIDKRVVFVPKLKNSRFKK